MFLIAGLTDHIAARPMRLKSLSDLVPFFVKARATKRYHLAKYLTSRCSRIIALSISTLTFIFGFLADITLNPKLFLIKNALAVASAPLEVLISLLYWGLTAVSLTSLCASYNLFIYILFVYFIGIGTISPFSGLCVA